MREESFWAGVFRCSSSVTFLPCPPLDLLLAARQGGCCAIRWSGRVCICVRKRGRKEQQQPSLLPVSVWVCGWVSVCFSLRQSLVRAASQGMWGGERERERERMSKIIQRCSACNDQFPYSRSLTSHPSIPPLYCSVIHLPLPPLKTRRSYALSLSLWLSHFPPYYSPILSSFQAIFTLVTVSHISRPH